jgi:hypothetical protein
MKPKTHPVKGKASPLYKFNKSPQDSKFLSEFQEVMIERLHLNHIGHYHKDNVKDIIWSILQRPTSTMNTKITGGFTLTCNVEPELYIQLQDTAKRITGEYIPMDELIHMLLTYFVYVYANGLPKKILPYKQVHKGRRRKRLLEFQKQFKQFYGNTVRSFNE